MGGFLSHFLVELKRRRVFRVAAAYVVVAFALLQGADIVFPALHLPGWTSTLVVVLALMGFPLAVVLAWAFDITPEGVKRTESNTEEPSETAPASSPITTQEPIERQSIAVLPFVNYSPEAENEYFSDGITEELIDRLVKIRGLRVAARTSSFAFKGQNADVNEIGRKLRVAHVLEGSVRKAGNRLRVTAQLIDVSDGYHLWSETYQRDLQDVFAIQDEISRAIVAALEVKLTGRDGAAARSRMAGSVEAYDLYLKGRHFLNKRTKLAMQQAVVFFREAIECDPRFARAYTGLADAYLVLSSGTHGELSPREALASAVSNAEQALALDETLSEAHVSLGLARMNMWDWTGAEVRLRQAIELDPGYAAAHHHYGWLLALMGSLDHALVEIERARELDPLSLPIQTATGRIFQFMRRPDDAIAQYRRVLDLDPNFAGAYFALGVAFLQKEMYGEAIALLQRAREMTGTHGATVLLAFAFASAGDRERAMALLNDLLERSKEQKEQYVSPSHIADIYVGLGEYDEAFAWYEKAYQERSPALVYFKVEPLLDPIRPDPRYERLLRLIGLAGMGAPAREGVPAADHGGSDVHLPVLSSGIGRDE